VGRRYAAGIEATGQGPRPTGVGHDPRGSTLSLYLDTSALIKLYVDEQGAAVVREPVLAGRRVATSVVAYVEARAAMTRRRRAGNLTTADYRRFVEDFDADWERFIRIDVSESLVRTAGALAETHRLRGYDALHLASALVFRDRLGSSPTFGCWDDQLDAAATREGFLRLRHR
jgi:uncharacterized protein